MFTSRLLPEQWAHARRLRAEGAAWVAIARDLGVSANTIAKRGRKEGWPTPAGVARPIPGPPAKRRPKSGAPLPAAVADLRRSLTQRMYRLMDTKLELMELRMQKQLQSAANAAGGDGSVPAADDDQDMQRLAAIIKTAEQVTELDPDLARTVDAGDKSADAQARASEADAFRREIAERIEKLIPPS
jgi:hypothetical protein